MDSDYVPKKGQVIWLLFDLSNGDPQSRQYVWWFRTRQQARDHKWYQESLRFNAKLSAPKRAVMSSDKDKVL